MEAGTYTDTDTDPAEHDLGPEVEPNDNGYGDEALVEPAEGYDEYDDPVSEPEQEALSEQEQALAQKLAGAEPEQQEAPDTFADDEGNVYVRDEDGDFVAIDQESGEELGWGVGEDGVPFEFEGDEEGEGEGDEVDAALDYVAGLQEREQRDALNAIEKDNPVVKEPEFLRELVRTAHDLAERAGNPDLATDPEYVRLAVDAVKARRAQANKTPAEVARRQGAPLEADAQSSRSAARDPESEWFEGIQGSGGSAFGD